MPKKETDAPSYTSATWNAREAAIAEVCEVVGAWTRLRYPEPDWWLVDPDTAARAALTNQRRELLMVRALEAVMARDWAGDIQTIHAAARQIVREIAVQVGVPAQALADLDAPYQPYAQPPVGDISQQVDTVVTALAALTPFQQRAALIAVANKLGLRISSALSARGVRCERSEREERRARISPLAGS